MKIEAARLRSRVASLLRALPWLMLVLSGSFASAGMPPASHPDLSGYWNLSIRIPRDPELMSRLPPGTVVLNDTGPVELPARDFGGLKVKPAALAAALAWKPADDMTLSKACKAPSIVYAMDGRKPPAEVPNSATGCSVGHWEGATHVVETTHLEAATITNNGLEHSNHARVVERFRLGEDGQSLLSTQQAQDRPPSAPAH